MYEATVYGDTTFTEFTDGFLTEHVKSVSVCDTEFVSKDRQVSRSVLTTGPGSSKSLPGTDQIFWSPIH